MITFARSRAFPNNNVAAINGKQISIKWERTTIMKFLTSSNGTCIDSGIDSNPRWSTSPKDSIMTLNAIQENTERMTIMPRQEKKHDVRFMFLEYQHETCDRTKYSCTRVTKGN